MDIYQKSPTCQGNNGYINYSKRPKARSTKSGWVVVKLSMTKHARPNRQRDNIFSSKSRQYILCVTVLRGNFVTAFNFLYRTSRKNQTISYITGLNCMSKCYWMPPKQRTNNRELWNIFPWHYQVPVKHISELKLCHQSACVYYFSTIYRSKSAVALHTSEPADQNMASVAFKKFVFPTSSVHRCLN